MALFNKLSGPILYKDSDEMARQIEVLEALTEKASDPIKSRMLKDIKLLEYGKQGEESVLFELMNSFIPMLILRDLRFEYENLSAQIDYLVITRKVICIIECKNLFGDIEVNKAGDFIRTLSFNGKKVREGIYSPVTQNARHLELLKVVRKSSKSNILLKMMFEKQFDENYKSIIALANTKTILDVRKADKELRNQIIRNDQLITHIKNINNFSKNPISSDKQMHDIAEGFMKLHQPSNVDYTGKYKLELDSREESKVDKEDDNKSDERLYQELKGYRLEKSREEGVKAYHVFTNSQLDELVNNKPISLEQLMKVSGFGEVKVGKFGQDIIDIITKGTVN